MGLHGLLQGYPCLFLLFPIISYQIHHSQRPTVGVVDNASIFQESMQREMLRRCLLRKRTAESFSAQHSGLERHVVRLQSVRVTNLLY
jgi:hypothetical protein